MPGFDNDLGRFVAVVRNADGNNLLTLVVNRHIRVCGSTRMQLWAQRIEVDSRQHKPALNVEDSKNNHDRTRQANEHATDLSFGKGTCEADSQKRGERPESERRHDQCALHEVVGCKCKQLHGLCEAAWHKECECTQKKRHDRGARGRQTAHRLHHLLRQWNGADVLGEDAQQAEPHADHHNRKHDRDKAGTTGGKGDCIAKKSHQSSQDRVANQASRIELDQRHEALHVALALCCLCIRGSDGEEKSSDYGQTRRHRCEYPDDNNSTKTRSLFNGCAESEPRLFDQKCRNTDKKQKADGFPHGTLGLFVFDGATHGHKIWFGEIFPLYQNQHSFYTPSECSTIGPMTDDQTTPTASSSDGSNPGTPVQDATGEIAKWKDLAARAQADLQNAKERLKREREEIGAFASEQFIRPLLPTLDNFQRAFLHLPEELKNHEWVKGVTAIEQELLKRVQEAGLKKIGTVGEPVNADLHEVLLTAPGEENTVLEVLENGYELNGKVLRPAKVKAGVKA